MVVAFAKIQAMMVESRIIANASEPITVAGDRAVQRLVEKAKRGKKRKWGKDDRREIRNLVASPWTAPSQSLMLRDRTAQFAEQNELIRAPIRSSAAPWPTSSAKKAKSGMFSWPHRAPRSKGCANQHRSPAATR